VVSRLLALLCALVTILASGPLEWELRPRAGCSAEDCCCEEVASCCTRAPEGPAMSAACGCGNHDPFVIHVSFEPLAPEEAAVGRLDMPRPEVGGRGRVLVGAGRTAPEPPPPRRG
jgi:hypothetical protein